MSDPRDRIAEALAAYHRQHSTVCEHTQIVEYGAAADAVMAVVVPVLNTKGLPVSPTPGSSELRDRVARSVRDAVRLRYGTNTREILERGGEVCLNGGEADTAADAALAVVQPELDRLSAKSGYMKNSLDHAIRYGTDVAALLKTERERAERAEASIERVRALVAEVRAERRSLTPLVHVDHVLAALDQPEEQACDRP